MALNPQERASVLATYLRTKDFQTTATQHGCSALTVRNIYKEFLKSQEADNIDTITTTNMAAVIEIVKDTAPDLLAEASHLKAATESLDRLTTSSHRAGETIMNKVTELVGTVNNVQDLNTLADTVFKVNQAFFSQGMQVNIQQNSVTEGSFASAISSRFTR